MGKHNVKITVIKTFSTEEVFNEKLKDEVIKEESLTCPKLSEGQEFLVDESGNVPEGFCHWAWADIHRDVNILRFGGHYPWMKENINKVYVSCTDGLRPVVFKLEAV